MCTHVESCLRKIINFQSKLQSNIYMIVKPFIGQNLEGFP